MSWFISSQHILKGPTFGLKQAEAVGKLNDKARVAGENAKRIEKLQPIRD